MKLLLSSLLLLAVTVTSINLPDIPSRKEGFPLESGVHSGLVIDAFLDPLCPDSLAAFNALNKMNETMANNGSW